MQPGCICLIDTQVERDLVPEAMRWASHERGGWLGGVHRPCLLCCGSGGPHDEPAWEPRGTPVFMLEGKGHSLHIQIGVHPKPLLCAGEPETRAGVIWGAIGGAGVTVLLAGCLCVTYFL